MKSDIFLNSTLAYCSHCGKTELARMVARESGVFMERVCPVRGTQRIKIVADYRWYREKMVIPQEIIKPVLPKPLQTGCPNDCGLCEAHTTPILLPIVSITNQCNLNCPICFTYNRYDHQYYKSLVEMRKILKHITEQTQCIELINITGGEPSLHPNLFDIFAICRENGINRITMNTNGLKIASDRKFAEKLKECGVQLVLSLDTLDSAKSKIIHGKDIVAKKRQALEIIEELQIPTTILAVCIKEVNEADVVEIVHTYFHKSFVRGITIQNMTFTGENGSQFEPRDHITIDEIEKLLANRGEFAQTDFFPLGSYHPLCYSVAYYILHNHKLLSLSKLIDRAILTKSSGNSYLLNGQQDFSTHFAEGINRLWAEGEDETLIKMLKDFLKELYPTNRILTAQERINIAEKRVKAIYIHPHMDADNFDIDRVSRCGDIVPDESGRMVPACSYNLLYRQQDSHFWVEKKKSI
ncbi:MAG: hypothetical protein BWK79_05750 [Beggiatoa sp. IS2]|nr:MAG: hypothetical protein BWK79_05750 [Beggiatoa sp. IS2]